MKVQSALLQTIALALVAASCTPEASHYAQKIKQGHWHADTLAPKDPAIDTLPRDTIDGRPITPDYCPPCGRG